MMLSEKLKTLRRKNNLTQQSLANELGLKRSTITQYESGRIAPSGNVLKNMASFFSVSVDMLLEDAAQIEEKYISIFQGISKDNSYIDLIINMSTKNLAKVLTDGNIKQFSNSKEVTYRLIESLLYLNYYAVKNKQSIVLLTSVIDEEKLKKVNENIQDFIKQIIKTEKTYSLIIK
ncbi:MAG: helix-turn-helix transcriptional regulator [Eubacteriales bacterium]